LTKEHVALWWYDIPKEKMKKADKVAWWREIHAKKLSAT
jgi:hypothetical protein